LVQPFLSYITRTKATIGLSTGATYDWEGDALSLPVSLTVNQLLEVGRIPVQLGAVSATGPTRPQAVLQAGATGPPPTQFSNGNVNGNGR
jgi:hypothetical protein